MRMFLIGALAAMLTVASAAADVSGTWKGTMDTPGGLIENTINLKQAGADVTGSVSLGGYGEGKIEKGKVDGDKIAFEVSVDAGKLTYEGTVAGDEMKLTVTGTTGNKYALVAKRQK